MEDLKLYVYRNYTVEPLFAEFRNTRFSGYDDISAPPGDFELIVWSCQMPLDGADEEAAAHVENLKNKLNLFLQHKYAATTVLFTLGNFYQVAFQNSSSHRARSMADYNNYLYSLADSHQHIKVIDLSSFIEQTDPKAIIDWKYYYISRMLINPSLAASFHEWFSGKLRAINAVRRKCILCDLDNTLWGGIVGEDGIEGIKLGNTYPGSAFKDFQKNLKEASARGVMLALCSKNNEADVWEVFEKHPDMELTRGDIVAHRINWADKASAITEIAGELNIGTDSMVFIDDNPAERELVRKLIPGIAVPDFPDQPYKLKEFFKTVYEAFFQVYRITPEDLGKKKQYHQNARRVSEKKTFASIADYLKSLDMAIRIEAVNSFNLPRIAQLTQKTNQFNCTTRRYTETDIRNLSKDGHCVACASVSDRFGDSGITAVCIIKFNPDATAAIDSYLLSCRILGRGIEDVFLATMLNYCRRRAVREITAEHIPTPKNMQTEFFFDKFGFKTASPAGAAKKYRLALRSEYPIEPFYRITADLGDREAG
jgi:FkbH-like protein